MRGFDTIVARAAVYNKFGWGEFSAPSYETVKLTSLPPRMEAPQIASQGRNSVTFVWKTQNMDMEGYSYELWQQANLGVYGKLIETLDDSYTVNDL